MHTLHYVILTVGLVFAILAMLQLSTPRINLMAAALAFLILSFLVTGCGFIKGVQQFDTNHSLAVTHEPIEKDQYLWNCSYVCYVGGHADSVGCRLVTASNERAARQQFHDEVFGEHCRITQIEKAK